MPNFKKRDMRHIISILILFFSTCAFCQVNDSLIRLQVFNNEIVDSVFVFGKWTKNGETQTELMYLGQITTDSGKVFKIINSSWIWGLSKRATNRILIYDSKNKYIGNYSLNTKLDLPDRLEESQLIFNNLDKDECDKSIITKIDLKQGFPMQIFIKCKGLEGDIFVFSVD